MDEGESFLAFLIFIAFLVGSAIAGILIARAYNWLGEGQAIANVCANDELWKTEYGMVSCHRLTIGDFPGPKMPERISWIGGEGWAKEAAQ